jgi:hypothetical protein
MARGRRHVCRQVPIYKSSPRLSCDSPGDGAWGLYVGVGVDVCGEVGYQTKSNCICVGPGPSDECRAGALSEAMSVARLFYFCLWPADGKHRVGV